MEAIFSAGSEKTRQYYTSSQRCGSIQKYSEERLGGNRNGRIVSTGR